LYSALSQLSSKYSGDTCDSFTCHHTRTISAFTPQSQGIITLWPVLILPTHRRMARLSLLGWLAGYIPRWSSRSMRTPTPVINGPSVNYVSKPNWCP